jgi:hypothetical protein
MLSRLLSSACPVHEALLKVVLQLQAVINLSGSWRRRPVVIAPMPASPLTRVDKQAFVLQEGVFAPGQCVPGELES